MIDSDSTIKIWLRTWWLRSCLETRGLRASQRGPQGSWALFQRAAQTWSGDVLFLYCDPSCQVHTFFFFSTWRLSWFYTVKSLPVYFMQLEKELTMAEKEGRSKSLWNSLFLDILQPFFSGLSLSSRWHERQGRMDELLLTDFFFIATTSSSQTWIAYSLKQSSLRIPLFQMIDFMC